ncbi:hypothetical protein GCM10023185_43140 [Hymenobacter saemangeumensis]|uniref:Uncharacterized protein n=1 Tax=Hymenobacter saemangeumensis TaxID=1084522 RepID=A0ABP8IRW8_9BACT
MLFVDNETIRYKAPAVRTTGSVRYAPSFLMRLADVRVVGYAPRIIGDDESGFLVLISAQRVVNYFNLDTVGTVELDKLKRVFGYNLADDIPAVFWEEANWQSFILFPKALAGQPLFQSWSWFSLRGFLKNFGRHLSLDNPMWERPTNAVSEYLAATRH